MCATRAPETQLSQNLDVFSQAIVGSRLWISSQCSPNNQGQSNSLRSTALCPAACNPDVLSRRQKWSANSGKHSWSFRIVSYRKGTAVIIGWPETHGILCLSLWSAGLTGEHLYAPLITDISTVTVGRLRCDLSFSCILNPNVLLVVGKEPMGKLTLFPKVFYRTQSLT